VSDATIGKDVAENLSGFQYTAERRSKNEKLVRAWLPYATVLVVDDVPMNLDVAKGMMKPYGMTVECVDSGQKAIDLIRENKTKYNAVFMDHMMPEMDGFEAVQIIRGEIDTEYAKTVPIIALTANAIMGNEDLFLKNGFQAFLSKPIDIIRLDMIINRYVRDKKIEQELKNAGGLNMPGLTEAQKRKKENKPSLLVNKTVDGIDFNAGLRRFENNEEIYLSIIKSYYSQIPNLLEKIQICTAETLGDYKIAVHSLKSTSYTIGAKLIGTIAESLEKAAIAGNLNYLRIQGAALIESVEKLKPALGDFLEEIRKSEQKPMHQAPDPEVLKKLLSACVGYDMELLDAAMAELEQYHYESQEDLVVWLREEIDKSELEIIQEQLEKLNLKTEEGKNGQ
jgi:CheY-like chemotaxis protein